MSSSSRKPEAGEPDAGEARSESAGEAQGTTPAAAAPPPDRPPFGLADLREEVERLRDEVARLRADEPLLQSALVSAHRTARQVVTQAEADAELTRSEAQLNAGSIIEDAQRQASDLLRAARSEQQRLTEEINHLRAAQRSLRAEYGVFLERASTLFEEGEPPEPEAPPKTPREERVAGNGGSKPGGAARGAETAAKAATIRATTQVAPAEPAPEAGAATTRGRIDSVSAAEVVGWAAQEGRAEPLVARLLVDGFLAAETQAAILRPGTKREGWHPTGECGFRFRLRENDQLHDGSIVRVLVGEDETEILRSPWTVGATAEP